MTNPEYHRLQSIARDVQLKPDEPLRVFVVAGEHSGDSLGAKLIPALRARFSGSIVTAGVGGPKMAEVGFDSLFPIDDVAVMGAAAILKSLPRIVRRVYQTVDAAKVFEPHLVVIIDSPEFTHPIAKRLRKQMPSVPIIDYVSPTIWAWRPGRAKKMSAYVDHVLALLPFEPDAHRRLNGPSCSYVGHPLTERLTWLSELDPDSLRKRLGLSASKPVLVALPGSRGSEISRLMEPFGQTIKLLLDEGHDFDVLLPTVTSRQEMIAELSQNWPVKPHIILGEDDKFHAFRLARAALAASGTVTLELALAETPMIVAYKVDPFMASLLRRIANVPSVVLANLVLGREPFPEYLQENCTPEKMAPAIAQLLGETDARAAQISALAEIRNHMQPGSQSPSQTAVDVILSYVSD